MVDSWNLAGESFSDNEQPVTDATARPFPTRRELREAEGRAAAAAASEALVPSVSPEKRPIVVRPIQATSKAVGKSASKPPRRQKLLPKIVTVSAMFGVIAMLVATSLPASIHGATSAAAVTTGTTAPQTTVQALTIDPKAVEQQSTRDSYTVVTKVQQYRGGKSNFDYTNDVNGTIQWPFPNPVPISSGFGPRIAPCSGCSSYHEGVDFIPGSGTPIQAIADGTVSLVSSSGALGYHVAIDHVINGQLVQSVYAHMQAGSVRVVVGQIVKVKDVLGLVGSTGESTGAHLHLEVHVDGTPVDPFAWLKANAN